jgi:hypothetical protein
MTAYSRNSYSNSGQPKERKTSLMQKKKKLQEEVQQLKQKLDRKREESMSRSKLGHSRRSFSRLGGSDKKGFINAKKSKNSKMLIEEIKRWSCYNWN